VRHLPSRPVGLLELRGLSRVSRRTTWALRPLVAWLASAGAVLAPSAATGRAPDYRLLERVDTYAQPKAVVLSPDESTAYVTNFGRRNTRNISIYRTDSLEETGTIDFPGNAVELVVTRDGRTMYASNFRQGVIEVIDLGTNAVTAEIAVGANPKTMALTADERTLFVSNWSTNDVSVVDLANGVETRRLQVGHHPRGIAVTAGGVLIIGNHADHTLSFLDTGTFDELHDDVPCGRFPRHVIVSPDQRFVYVSAQSSAAVFQVDASSGEVLQKWAAGFSP
jgi:YVTN family beta-propeller protein